MVFILSYKYSKGYADFVYPLLLYKSFKFKIKLKLKLLQCCICCYANIFVSLHKNNMYMQDVEK